MADITEEMRASAAAKKANREARRAMGAAKTDAAFRHINARLLLDSRHPEVARRLAWTGQVESGWLEVLEDEILQTHGPVRQFVVGADQLGLEDGRVPLAALTIPSATWKAVAPFIVRPETAMKTGGPERSMRFTSGRYNSAFDLDYHGFVRWESSVVRSVHCHFILDHDAIFFVHVSAHLIENNPFPMLRQLLFAIRPPEGVAGVKSTMTTYRRDDEERLADGLAMAGLAVTRQYIDSSVTWTFDWPTSGGSR